MLTADLVRTRRRGNELSVVTLTDKTRARALSLAEQYQSILSSHRGESYAELKEAWGAVELSPRDKKLAQGLQKLLEDQVDLDSEVEIDPRQLRSAVFLAAAEQRRKEPRSFDRHTVLEQVAQTLDAKTPLTPEALDVALYADLKGQKRIQRVPKLSSESLVERYDLAQHQAVLLRATKVTALVRCADVAAYRELFRALKFRRLLYTIEQQGKGYRIEIDGPFSLFDSVTKYGLQLALVFPQLLACEQLELSAELRWGKERTPLGYKFESKGGAAALKAAPQVDEVADLRERFEALGSDWSVRVNDQILNLPGIGVVVPDLVFQCGQRRVFFELLGFWSRDAVWKRVELIERGLPENVLFAVSNRLRVSEAVLDSEEHGALYVFKGSLNPKRILAKLEQFA